MSRQTTNAPANTDSRLRGLLIIWCAQLSSLMLLFLVTLYVRVPFNGGRDNTARWALGALGTMATLGSFLVKRRLLIRARDEGRPDVVTTAYVAAFALCEATGICAVISYFVSGVPYHFLLFVAALGLLLNVPRRRALEAATPLMPTDTAAPANGAAFRSTF